MKILKHLGQKFHISFPTWQWSSVLDYNSRDGVLDRRNLGGENNTLFPFFQWIFKILLQSSELYLKCWSWWVQWKRKKCRWSQKCVTIHRQLTTFRGLWTIPFSHFWLDEQFLIRVWWNCDLSCPFVHAMDDANDAIVIQGIHAGFCKEKETRRKTDGLSGCPSPEKQTYIKNRENWKL